MRDYDALAAYIADRTDMPFDWRDYDCAVFAAGAIAAQTGRKVLKRRWTSALGYQRFIARNGGMEACVDAVLTRVPVALAARGDIAGVPQDNGALALMLVEGATLTGPGPNGLIRVPRAAMTMAWSAE